VRVAAGVHDAFFDGTAWVSLASVADSGLVLPAIAQGLDVQATAGYSLLELVKAFLHARQVGLLLDNVEQVVAAAPPIGELGHAAPYLTLLSTSHIALWLAAEICVPHSTAGPS